MNDHKVQGISLEGQGSKPSICQRLRIPLICLSPRRRSLQAILIAAITLAFVGTLINTRIIYPAFTDIIVEGITDDAKRIGAYLLPPSLKHTTLTHDSLTPRFFGDIYKLENDFGLMKVLVLSATGEILYSTIPKEVGKLNTNPQFADIVAKGTSFTKLVNKGAKTLEGEDAKADVVETYVPLMSGNRFLGAFEFYFDITKRKQRLDHLVMYSTITMVALSAFLLLTVIFLIRKEAARQQAQEKAETLKEEVDRITRHDLKAPVTGVLSGLTYLESFTELTGEQLSITTDMRKAANTILDMVNRSFDLFKMETGTYPYEPVAMDLLVVSQRAKTDLSELARITNVEVTVTLRNSGDSMPLSADETLCYLLIANLLKNAIEASTSGDTVTLTLEAQDDIIIAVHNPTVVPEEVRNNFFEKYATSGKTTGTGIGTYSAKLMAKTMGGSIKMTTSEEDGTTVTVTLPKS